MTRSTTDTTRMTFVRRIAVAGCVAAGLLTASAASAQQEVPESLQAVEVTTPEQEVLMAWYIAYERGDISEFEDLFTEDLVWDLTPGTIFAREGGVQGRNTVFNEYFPAQVDYTGDKLQDGWKMSLD